MKIKELNLDDPVQRAEFEKARKAIREKLKPAIEAIEDSQRITAADLAITINAK